MFVVRNYVTMGGTVFCALAIGYLMQNGSAAQPDTGETRHAMAATSGEGAVIAGLQGIVLTSSSPSRDSGNGAALPTRRTVRPEQSQAKPQVNCAISARAFAAPNASARLTVKAPCNGDQAVELHHSGMTFTGMTDARGNLDVTIPALSEYAIFLVSFDDKVGTAATTHIPDIAEFERIALQWHGDTDLQLHALEFGAGYGQAGHVWANSETDSTGQVVHLGLADAGQAKNVELYSFPAGSTDQSGTVALTVEAEVTEANCGRDLSVQSLELRSDRRLRSRDLTLTLPDCGSGNDFLVLNNLFQDLTIAAK